MALTLCLTNLSMYVLFVCLFVCLLVPTQLWRSGTNGVWTHDGNHHVHLALCVPPLCVGGLPSLVARHLDSLGSAS